MLESLINKVAGLKAWKVIIKRLQHRCFPVNIAKGLGALFFKKKLYAPILWVGCKFLKATEPLRGDSLQFTTKSKGVPGAELIDLGRMKG